MRCNSRGCVRTRARSGELLGVNLSPKQLWDIEPVRSFGVVGVTGQNPESCADRPRISFWRTLYNDLFCRNNILKRFPNRIFKTRTCSYIGTRRLLWSHYSKHDYSVRPGHSQKESPWHFLGPDRVLYEIEISDTATDSSHIGYDSLSKGYDYYVFDW